MTQIITAETVIDIIGPVARPKAGSAMRSRQDNIIANLVDGINQHGKSFGLDQLVNLSRFIGQTAIESDYYRTTTEYASGKAYEGRKDLGNIHPGDGPKFRGHGLIQTTGRDNHTRFTIWLSKKASLLGLSEAPDFVAEPDKLALFPWAFLSAVYFWDEGNRTGRSLNEYAKDGNDEMLTRIINGGLNHYGDRLDVTTRAALRFLHMTEASIRPFQLQRGLTPDGIIGKKTRSALHEALRTSDSARAQNAAMANFPQVWEGQSNLTQIKSPSGDRVPRPKSFL